MRSFGLVLVVGVTTLLGVAPSGASSPTSGSPYAASWAYGMPSAEGDSSDDFEVSGPLEAPPPHRAVIRVRLPYTWGEVGFDGRKVDSVGRSRTYVTPELSGARTFEVTASWKTKGRTVWLMEKVTVKAGQTRTLDFTSGN